MKPVRELFRKFQSSDGRMKALTASGVLALAVVAALAIGVLPALAAPDVPGEVVNWGGGSGACDDALVSLLDGTARGPSAAMEELHVENPKHGQIYKGSDDTEFKLYVSDSDTKVRIEMLNPGGKVFYDVIINGGKKSNHYDFDADSVFVSDDDGFMAPEKDNQEGVNHRISHINLCYDYQLTHFDCGAAAVPPVEIESAGGEIFTVVNARIFANSENPTCSDKDGLFFTDWPETEDPDVLLDFGAAGGTLVTGRLDITKDFGSPPFADLRYLHDDLTSGAVDVSWCNIRPAVAADLDTDGDGSADGNPFADVLDAGDYPTLEEADGNPAVTDEVGVPALACKVHVEETATGIQYNVVYFEFLDPNFF